jgi:hypothetical protein
VTHRGEGSHRRPDGVEVEAEVEAKVEVVAMLKAVTTLEGEVARRIKAIFSVSSVNSMVIMPTVAQAERRRRRRRIMRGRRWSRRWD